MKLTVYVRQRQAIGRCVLIYICVFEFSVLLFFFSFDIDIYCSTMDGCSILQDLATSQDTSAQSLGTQVNNLLNSSHIDLTCPIKPQNITLTNVVIRVPSLPNLGSVLADVSMSKKIHVTVRYHFKPLVHQRNKTKNKFTTQGNTADTRGNQSV